MSNATKRGAGIVEEIAGAVQQKAGKILGNERMEAEGHVKKIDGQDKQEAAKAAERLQGAVEEATGALKSSVGKVVDDKQMRIAGKAKQLKGEARQKLNH